MYPNSQDEKYIIWKAFLKWDDTVNGSQNFHSLQLVFE